MKSISSLFSLFSGFLAVSGFFASITLRIQQLLIILIKVVLSF